MSKSRELAEVRGFLIDLDGVMFVGHQVVPGAAQAIEFLRDKQIPFRFSTNTTTLSKKSLIEKLNRLGVNVAAGEVFGVVEAAAAWLDKQGRPTCYFLLSEDTLVDFAGYPTDNESPDVILVGDIGKVWDYDLINRLCRMVMGGARLVALHKGKYWETDQRLQVDIGAFIAGIEYVTGQKAQVVGKPSAEFFSLAAESMNLPMAQLAMIGDDLDTDVGGAQLAGMRGLLVRTGKFREDIAEASPVRPDLVIDSLADLPALLD